MLTNCKLKVNLVVLLKINSPMKLQNNINRLKKKVSYEYWILTIKLKLYALKYRRALEMPYA